MCEQAKHGPSTDKHNVNRLHTKIKQSATVACEAQTRHGTPTLNRKTRARRCEAREGVAERTRAREASARITNFLDIPCVPCRVSVGQAVSDAEAERSGARVRERQAKSERVRQRAPAWVGGGARGAERHAQQQKKGDTNV